VTGSTELRVGLGGTLTSVTAYDPTVGTTPTLQLKNVSSISMVLSNHPVVLEMARGPKGRRRTHTGMRCGKSEERSCRAKILVGWFFRSGRKIKEIMLKKKK